MRIASGIRRFGIIAFLIGLPVTALAQGSVQLQWTAPGDDGMVGVATSYDVRYHLLPITDQNFILATSAPSPPAPGVAGTTQTLTISNLTIGNRYYFAIKSRDDQGNQSPLSNVVSYIVTGAVGVGDAPLVLSFSRPFPNPARTQVTVEFVLPEAREVSAEIFDVGGRHIRSFPGGLRGAGRHTLAWDTRDDNGRPVAAGQYIVQAHLGRDRFVQRVTVLQ
ncbi:MAG: hypothetical protein HOP12_14625 [Candidatus Eisenbacteria bacterium]|uniref:Fibronectin type-III domain-containing protein n=1 Tax=Eiseniibacteriota bacterium TaxID=2212470 RepID=A0A849SLA1_UNCEI|nr:hypothetical protein [Candidatus Eisenbacteria bacterium]